MSRCHDPVSSSQAVYLVPETPCPPPPGHHSHVSRCTWFETFELGAQAELFTPETADELAGLWQTYYNGLS